MFNLITTLDNVYKYSIGIIYWQDYIYQLQRIENIFYPFVLSLIQAVYTIT